MEEMVFGRRYRVTEKIGSGGMADVFKAVDEVLGRTVAVKVLHPRYASDPTFVARFRQEAQAAANLSHPGIVNIYDWGRDDDTYYIVMEYVHGTDLKAIVTEHGAIDPLKAAEYGAQAAAALSVAHGYDIIHRDIKPHNIVLTPDGTVKVMDFGIARAGNTNMTQTGSVLGTAHYVSPEQAQGRTLTPASDLYSLGVVLYELVTGRVPFEGDTPVSVALKQVNEEPVPPREIDPEVPRSIENVILRAMAKEPAERYASAEEMRRDLMRAASGRVVEVAPTPDETSVMPAVERTASAGAPRVRPVPRRSNPWPWIALAIVFVAVAVSAAWAFGLFDTTERIVVPDLAGMTEAQATEALASVELTIGPVEERFSEEATGTVISQSPEPGVELAAGSEVGIVLSRGRELFALPDFSGSTESEAIRSLQAAGYKLETIKREFSKDVPDGVVIRQEPAAGMQVPSGAAVTLFVSKGRELKQVPSVVGNKRADAEKTLKDAGFVPKVSEEFSDTIERGYVIRQSPEGGVSIDAGSEIVIAVSKGPNIAEVPDVIDKTEAEARTLLENAGFDVQVSYQVSPDDGIVLTQDPVPGAEARVGSVVTIWVGKAPSP